MTPEYVLQMASMVDPDELWRLPVFDQMHLEPQLRYQLDAGVALRRYASHLQELQSLLGTGRSLLITPMIGGTATTSIPAPLQHQALLVQAGLQQEGHA